MIQIYDLEHAPLLQLDGDSFMGMDVTGKYLRRALLTAHEMQAADFTGANLTEASLSAGNAEFACFDRADLAGAALRDCNLRHATFRGANLAGAKFINCDLSDADFSGACLDDVDLAYCKGATVCGTIHAVQFPGYNVVLLPDRIWVGCKVGTVEWWRKLTRGQAEVLKPGSWAHWKRYGGALLALHRAIYGG